VEFLKRVRDLAESCKLAKWGLKRILRIEQATKRRTLRERKDILAQAIFYSRGGDPLPLGSTPLMVIEMTSQ